MNLNLKRMKDNPTDTITSLNFSDEKERDILIATSWDKKMHVYTCNDIPLNFEKAQINSISFDHPQLDSTFHHGDTSYCYAVGLDNAVKKISLETLSYFPITEVSSSVYTRIIHNSAGNCLYTADTDKNLHVNDDRLKGLLGKYQQEISITGMCFNHSNYLILTGVAQNGSNMIKVSDIRKLSEYVKFYENPCKSEISSLCPLNSDGFLLGTVEGKIGMENFDSSSQNYSFKCHREETETSSFVYSVNTLALNKKDSSVFLSGGSDKFIYGWDNKKRKKIFKSMQFPEPITHMCFNSNGNYIAIASSWLYEDGVFDISTELRHKIYLKSFDELGNLKKTAN